MRAVVQRVHWARVEVGAEVVGEIGRGLLVYVGFARSDAASVRRWMLTKILALRIFESPTGGAEASVTEIGGAVLLVSQFTLYADVRRGRRPSYGQAMPPDEAQRAYEAAVEELRTMHAPVATGRFRAHMAVTSANDGPMTIALDSNRDAPQEG